MDKNMTLEKRIAAELYSYQGKMSVFVDDLQGHTVEIGADEKFETASTIKAFILAALYLQVSRGKASLEEEITYEESQFVDGSGMLRALGVGAKLKVKDTATMMIICSDNIATNMIIDYLGLDTINACIRELGFGHTVLHNPLHFDRYDDLGTTTPRDYAALFAQVAKGTLVSKEASAEMLAIFRQQHYNTMLSRFRGFPVKIEMLSRFVSKKDQDDTKADIKSGKADIVVGTHKLLQKDIEFRSLGLLIIDEEQRFGVTHKEKLKMLSENVDSLTLTATPIPRTLNMALSGIRDMSVLEEAPQDRMPVQSYVLEHDEAVIGEAIRRELRRGGQVFYLHNLVDTIYSKAEELGREFPQAVIAIAHGKMDKDELSDVWKSMVEGEIDILVCTTIIETGVDIPNANTLIIEDADRMGLSQLHQIRGRVGRSSRRAYAYFTYRPGAILTEIASKRLEAIKEFTEFGSGFKIAMRDLELRGAGNILGAEQSGHMADIGYDLYIKILEEAVNEEKGIVLPKKEDCQVDILCDAYIPDEYIPSGQVRIDMYRKIASIASPEDEDEILDELYDRFGEPPVSVTNLLKISLIRNSAAESGIKNVSQKQGIISFYPTEFDMRRCVEFAALPEVKGRVMISTAGKPYFSVKTNFGENSAEIAETAINAYKSLKSSINNT